MDSIELNRLLVESLPELRQQHLDEVSWQDGDSTGSHVVYGDVFTPTLLECLSTPHGPELARMLSFVESVLEKEDEYAENVIAVSVLESVAFRFNQDPSLAQHLGSKSKRLLNELG